MTRTVPVQTSRATYSVHVGAGVLSSLNQIVRDVAPKAQRIHAVIDTGVPSEIIERTLGNLTLDGYVVSRSSITPSEDVKITETWLSVLGDAANARLERSDLVIAIGGGIVGDIAGFVAASYRRGLAVIQCPTTLLAMVDASVGGKTGVNLASESGLLKNAIGAFHQPAAVIADTSTLGSLSPRVFRAGIAECVKHSMLSADFGDADLASWMQTNEQGILDQDPAVLTEFVSRNVAVKAEVVKTDEHETSTGDMGRALLNLGHTFAHAFETLPGVRSQTGDDATPIMHGEAVALGLLCAATLGERIGKASGLTEPLRDRLSALGLPTRCEGLGNTQAIIARMAHDKKAQSGQIRFVVPVGAGRCRVVRDVPEDAVVAALDTIREG